MCQFLLLNKWIRKRNPTVLCFYLPTKCQLQIKSFFIFFKTTPHTISFRFTSRCIICQINHHTHHHTITPHTTNDTNYHQKLRLLHTCYFDHILFLIHPSTKYISKPVSTHLATIFISHSKCIALPINMSPINNSESHFISHDLVQAINKLQNVLQQLG